MNFLAIIPARYASTRFPGKPLALLGGKPVIEHVWRRVSSVVEAIVATDDPRIYDAVSGFGGRAIMTSVDHPSGTDRCLEAFLKSGSTADAILNVQGDEPFVSSRQLEALMTALSAPEVDIATLAHPVADRRTLENPNAVKVVRDLRGMALYFSRSPIPFDRGGFEGYLKHIGLYGFRTPVLQAVARLERTPLERAESLEQLRWIENGYRIAVALTDQPTIGIDTLQDLEAAEKYLSSL